MTIYEFSKITHLLYELLGKEENKSQQQTENQKFAFTYLKHLFTSNLILVQCDPIKKLCIEADSLDFATAAILSMLCDNGLQCPCAYISKSLSSAEKNYMIYDKEMLTIIRALEDQRHYLEGADHQIEIWTDHQNLEYFMTAQKLNRRQA